jgi:bis(5'-nucleosyl)-tetraphosphatase (symmetrical)
VGTYCIGDVQGCYRELQELLDLIAPSAKDTFWFVGDLVNRGPESAATLRLIKNLPHKIVVLGNHDFHLLSIYYKAVSYTEHTMQDILTAKDGDELVDWLRQQLLFYWDNNLQCALVHAGIYPFWTLTQAQQYAQEVTALLKSEEYYLLLLKHLYGNLPSKWDPLLQDFERWRFIINSFVRMRFCDTGGNLDFTHQGKVGTQPQGYMPWFEIPARATKNIKIIFGHWAALEGKTNNANAVGLDTGCIWGNSLSAMRLEDGRRFEIKCKK